jgi:hypothetical protein
MLASTILVLVVDLAVASVALTTCKILELPKTVVSIADPSVRIALAPSFTSELSSGVVHP